MTLTLSVGAEHGETGIQVSYTPGTKKIRDVPGNEAEALSRQSVANETPDSTPAGGERSGDQFKSRGGPGLCGGDEIEVTVTSARR